MRALTPAHKEGGEALDRASEAINRKAVCPLSCGNGLCDCGGFRACRDGVEVASLRLPCTQSSTGENTGDGNPCAAAERGEFMGRGGGIA